MLITRLRLAGFKSFVEPAEMMIEPGLTGVVGPNGCGKSNLLEALRWVMGETSYKSMRASAMDDVIFAGTTARPQRNMAEVTVVIDNTDRKAPAEYNDEDTLEIARRIEREAGSAYRINGKEVRAKDVRILFEDAATGARSPALVRQGQIGQIVNARPEQRRRILEDAAGIAGLHSRRHDAELRLKAAEGNLVRLGDITGAMTSQIEQLKRQARQARRYSEISDAIRRCEAAVLYVGWRAATARVEEEEANVRAVEAELREATEAEAAALLAETERVEAVEPLRRSEAEAAAAFTRLKHEADATEREQTAARARLDELQRQIERHQADLEREAERKTEAEDLAEAQRAKVVSIAAQQQELSGRRDALAVATAQQTETVEALEVQLNGIRSDLAQREADRRAQAARCEDLSNQITRLEGLRRELAREHQTLADTAPDEAAQAAAAKSLERARGALKAADEALAAQEAALQSAEHTADQARDASRKATLAHTALATEAEALARILATSNSQGDARPILDAISVTPGYERALGAALGDDLGAPLQDNGETAHWRNTEHAEANDDPTLPNGVTALADYVDAPLALARRLAQVGLVSPDQGPTLQNRLASGQRLVSRDGDLWRWDGYSVPATAHSPAAVRLAERNRLAELGGQAQAAAKVAAQAEEARTEAEDELATARARRDEARADLEAKRAELATREQDYGRMDQQAVAHRARSEALADRWTQAEADYETARARLKTADQALSDLAPTDALTREREALEGRLKDARAELTETQTSLSLADRERQTLDARSKEAVAEAERWRLRGQEAERHVARLESDIASAQSEAEALSGRPDALEERLRDLREQANEADARRMRCADDIVRATTAASAAAQDLRRAQSAVGTLRETKARAETRRDAARSERAEAAGRISSSLDIEPAECAKLGGLDPDADTPLPDLATLEAKLAKLLSDRERLGGVNLGADQELTRLESEYERLAKEAADVEEAVRKLRAAIGRLNGEARKRLTAAFDNVNARFADLFQTLFDGGEARLELIASDDPLESGLEIIAKPPGKKPATLSLLSGGEQALTALSLIFAVFLTNPSPICVLDEVDAPLDDANVDRFCALLDTMTERTDTRFLVITHHPMTMSRMHRLYGVTMAERGVSQLVSVDLGGAERFLEAS